MTTPLCIKTGVQVYLEASGEYLRGDAFVLPSLDPIYNGTQVLPVDWEPKRTPDFYERCTDIPGRDWLLIRVAHSGYDPDICTLYRLHILASTAGHTFGSTFQGQVATHLVAPGEWHWYGWEGKNVEDIPALQLKKD